MQIKLIAEGYIFLGQARMVLLKKSYTGLHNIKFLNLKELKDTHFFLAFLKSYDIQMRKLFNLKNVGNR